MNHKKIQEISRLLFKSLQDCSTIEPLTESYPEITIDDVTPLPIIVGAISVVTCMIELSWILVLLPILI